MALTGYKVGTNDIDNLFTAGSGGAATNYKVNGTDLNALYAPYSSGTKVSATGFKIGGTDFADRFQPKSTFAVTWGGGPYTAASEGLIGGSATVSVRFDVAATITQVAPSSTTVPTVWGNPTGGTPGNSYWIRCRMTSGTNFNGNLNVWSQLSANQIWSLTRSSTGGTTSGTATIEIASDSAGATIVGSANVTLQAILA